MYETSRRWRWRKFVPCVHTISTAIKLSYTNLTGHSLELHRKFLDCAANISVPEFQCRGPKQRIPCTMLYLAITSNAFPVWRNWQFFALRTYTNYNYNCLLCSNSLVGGNLDGTLVTAFATYMQLELALTINIAIEASIVQNQFGKREFRWGYAAV